MGIYNVSVGTATSGFNNPTIAGVTDGYQDYSCLKKATVLEGTPIPIAVTTNPNANENVRVWIDLNNDGAYNTVSELVYSSNNARIHIGNFTIPVSSTVLKNTVLRMRIAADNFSSPIPDPCSTPAYSQTEDYGITIIPNTGQPKTDFSVNKEITCSPTVQFQDLTQNGVTSYLWDFGDNTTSTSANPSHSYAQPGTYTVKLKTCNTGGCDSLIKINYINYHTNVPVAASCAPATVSYCCGYGITKVTFHTLVNSSLNGASGYEDFSCSKSVQVTEGFTYNFALETNQANSQDTWVYIDYNNDGSFSSGELVFTQLNKIDPAGVITVDPTTFRNTPLRMRIISDVQGSQSGACLDRTSGQVEDYTLFISQAIFAPVVDFSSSFANSCDTLVQFTDRSTNAPTSWLWDFGDGSTKSPLQNPVHNYSANGTYTVSLTTCNTNGCDSLTKVSYITVKKPCIEYCIPAGNNSSWFYINNFSFNTINNASGADFNAHGNYTHLTTSVVKGNTYIASIGVSRLYFARNITIWIDLNQDGDFDDADERVANNITNNMIPVNFAQVTIPVSAKTGTTRMRVMLMNHAGPIHPCTSNSSDPVETEDYSILILPNNQPPTAGFSADNQVNCSYNVLFQDNSSNSPTSWSWNFGDPASGAANTSTLENPRHIFSAAGNYTVTLTVCNAFGCDTITRTNYITITNNTGPKNTVCYPRTEGNINICTEFGTIDECSNDFGDFTCTERTTLIQGVPHLLEVYGSTSLMAVRAWIDYNNDGIFQPTSELVLDADSNHFNQTYVVPPSFAVLHTPLRMRVIASAMHNLPPTPCGQTVDVSKDFTVTVVPNTNSPVVYFSANATNNCGEEIIFTDSTAFLPTSWSWNFGDPASGANNTSTLQNPTHFYSSAGTYTVTLVACNANGCDTLTKTNYITTTGNINTAYACKPQNSPVCSGYGIKKVNFLSINSLTADCSEGFRELTCTYNAQTVPGVYPLEIENSNYNENVQVWIDFNNDGQFDTSERVMHSVNAKVHKSFVSISNAVIKNTWLRMRVMSISATAVNATPAPCANLMYEGQAEDYAIMVVPNNNIPTVAFTADKDTTCNPVIAFTENAYGATSWSWDFGDPASGAANTSTLKDPTHTFSGPGSYNVSLTACNVNGCSTVVQNAMVTIINTSTMAPVCTPITTMPLSFSGITNVEFSSINHTSGNADEGNLDLTCDEQTEVFAGAFYPLIVTTDPFSPSNVAAWIDYNNDGTFAANEQVMSSLNKTVHSQNVTIPASATQNTYLRMRVMLDYYTEPAPLPCTPLVNGQYEDYAIVVKPNQFKPAANFGTTSASTCNPDLSFTDSSNFAPTSWTWNFGNPQSGASNTSTLQNPTHTYNAPGIYPVELIACNAFGCDTITQNREILPFINVLPAACKPATLRYCCQYGIRKVGLNTIQNTSDYASEGYQDFSCTQNTVLNAGSTYTLNVETSVSSTENVNGWIDYNNDGLFTTNEQIINSTNTRYHTVQVTIPATAVTGSWLRMRIISDISINPIQSACADVDKGQAEDYAVMINPVSGVTEQELAGQVSIYPNPNNGTFTVKIPTVLKGETKIAVQDLTGKTIAQQLLLPGNSIYQLNFDHLAKGVYLVKILNTDLTLIKKIIIE